MEKILETAYAKINLGLDVVGKRSDGYHEVRMVMQSVGLADTLEFIEAEGLKLDVLGSNLDSGADNLACKAAVLLAREAGINPNVHIKLHKKIFLAAGLAGGSSDAAAVLRGLNKLWGLKLSATDLRVLAAKLGSDIPFCIEGGTALAEGRGEIITDLPQSPEMVIVLAKPKIEVSTAWVYGNYQANEVLEKPDIDGIIAALEVGNADALLTSCGNVLESVTINKEPVIATIKQRMVRAGAAYALMSGSGPTVFAFAPDKAIAGDILEDLQDLDLETAITTTKTKERV